MTYQMTRFSWIPKAVLFGAMTIVLAACDSGSGDATNDSAAEVEASAPAETNAAATPADAVQATEIQITVPRDENGVAIGAITVGDPNAPVEMIEYVSVTCPHCARHHTNVWPEIKERWVAAGQVKVTFRMFARSSLDEIVSMVPFCSTNEKAYPVLDLIMSRQGQWLRGSGQEALDNVAGLARRAGMSRASFDACVRTPELLANLREMTTLGIEDDRVTGTPFFVVGSENFSGEFPIGKFEEVINGEL